MIDVIPLPSRDGPFEGGFWAALDQERLAHQQCEACGEWSFPPRWRCVCGGPLAYRTVSGRATLWSWTVVHPPVLPSFAALTPYVAGVVQLAESPALRMVGPLILEAGDPLGRVNADQLSIGMPLTAHIQNIAPDVRWPAWRLGA